jgi:8-oxo-dGTP diphosphatase
MQILQNHQDFDRIDWNTWKPTDQATLCFVQRENQVLLIEKKRGLGKGKVNGPGGKFDPGETAEACAIRETQEELGVTPLHLEHRGKVCFQFTNGYGIEAHLFHASDLEGEPIETEEAIPLWTPLDAIPYSRMWADDILWLPHFLNGKHIEGVFLFDDEEMLGVRMEIS